MTRSRLHSFGYHELSMDSKREVIFDGLWQNDVEKIEVFFEHDHNLRELQIINES